MSRKPKRPCAEMNCNNLTTGRYCELHKNLTKKSTQIYNKYYRDKTINSFYQSKEWRRVRNAVIARDNYLCQRCLKKGIIKRADVVHHIIEVKEDWSKRLDMNNLESLCHACHNAEHKSTPHR